MDADSGFSHSYSAAMCPQVEPDVDHYRSTAHAAPPFFFTKRGSCMGDFSKPFHSKFEVSDILKIVLLLLLNLAIKEPKSVTYSADLGFCFIHRFH